jgi:hypothetical protein
MTAIKDYAHLEGQFRKVRARWKRAAALSGLALVLLESVGIFTVVILLSLLYGHLPWLRVGAFGAGVVAVLALVVRHVVLPLMRQIPDEQVALYVEENNDKFEGSLMTAAEFGRKTGFTPLQQRMVQAVVHVADARAQAGRVSRVVSFARLRKYGVAAAVSVGIYVLMCAAFPQSVGRHVVGALQPWRTNASWMLGPDGRPLPAGMSPAELRRLMPIDFKLSKADLRVARGDDFELEAQLSREADRPVLLEFRTCTDPQNPGPWRQLPMSRIEKLYSFARKLDSVSEDIQYRVSAGEFVSQTHRITVYDRIELRGVQITTKYPDYLKFPERTDTLSSGDVSAPVGSHVTVRVLVNTELTSGRLVWEDGAEQPLTVDAAQKTSAFASFPVDKPRRYSFEVKDIDGQVAKSLGVSEVFALPDNPPTVDMISPAAQIETHPLGEVLFEAKITDDFGVDKADLVYIRLTEKDSGEGRVPMVLKRPSGESIPLPEVVDATLRFLLENVKPAFREEEVISWYVEARDRNPKNPPAVSDLQMIVVAPFETWGAYMTHPAEEHHPEEGPPMTLAELLLETWAIHKTKPLVKPADFQAKCTALAEKMIMPNSTDVWDFIKPALPHHPTPRQVAAGLRAQVRVVDGQKALAKFDTAEAAKQFRMAIADLVAAGIVDDETLMKMPPAENDAGGTKQETRLQETFAEVKVEEKAGSQIENNLNQAEAAARAREAVQEVRKQQQGVLNQAKELAKGGAEAAQPAAAKPAADLGKKEEGVADKAKAAADQMKAKDPAGDLAKAAEKVDRATDAMKDAAAKLAKGEVAKAVTAATEADRLLGQAEADLKEMRYDQLSNAVNEAEAMAEALVRDQGDIRAGTEAVQKEAAAAKDGELTAKQKRELKKLAFQQATAKGKLENFSDKMDKLNQWASDTARTDTAKQIQDAHRQLQRSQPGQKMASSVVELTALKPAAAAEPQKEAEAGLAQTLAKLQAASDTLAATREEGLKRALREAKAVEKGVDQLANADGKPEPAKGEDKTGKPENKTGKPDDKTGKPEDKTAKGEDKTGKPEDKTGKGEDKTAKGGEKPDQNGGKQLTPEQRRELGKEIASGLRRLDRQVTNRDFNLSQDVAVLSRVAKDPTLDAKLASDADAQKRLRDIISRVSDKLEAELESTAKATRILSSEQEECPPKYRLMVNKYYEALSKKPR